MYNEILKKKLFYSHWCMYWTIQYKIDTYSFIADKDNGNCKYCWKKILMFHRIDSKTSIFLYYSLAKGFRFTRSAPHNWRVAGWTKDLWLLQCAMSAKWQQWYVPLSNPNKHIIVFCCSPFLWTLTLKLIITLFK